MKKLKCILLGSLLLMALPQGFADIGDTQSAHLAYSGASAENFSDCYACVVLSPW